MCELHIRRGSGGDYAGGIARAVLTDEQLEAFGAACPAYGGWGRAKTCVQDAACTRQSRSGDAHAASRLAPGRCRPPSPSRGQTRATPSDHDNITLSNARLLLLCYPAGPTGSNLSP